MRSKSIKLFQTWDELFYSLKGFIIYWKRGEEGGDLPCFLAESGLPTLRFMASRVPCRIPAAKDPFEHL